MNCKLQLFDVIKFAVCLNSYATFLLLCIFLIWYPSYNDNEIEIFAIKHPKQIMTFQNQVINVFDQTKYKKNTRILGWMKSMCEWSGGKITTFSRDHLSKLSSYTVSLDSSEYRKEVASLLFQQGLSIQQHIFVCWPTATFENGVLIIGCGRFL